MIIQAREEDGLDHGGLGGGGKSGLNWDAL